MIELYYNIFTLLNGGTLSHKTDTTLWSSALGLRESLRPGMPPK